jgi:hypothetical protein
MHRPLPVPFVDARSVGVPAAAGLAQDQSAGSHRRGSRVPASPISARLDATSARTG